ncbi:unnamed protein product [Adineta steineri]|uniref:Uncharacterized protein n=1 Tax=Adineta steineri TaxID=433720 RepID=A0A815J4M2_9BILA|nr:unnamed protein product [Adineta steineri]CAF1384475.1 unnamed protein product [Adineta steineri]
MASVGSWNKNSHLVIRVSSGLSAHSLVDILNDFVVMEINATTSTNIIVGYTTDTLINVCMQMSIQPTEI